MMSFNWTKQGHIYQPSGNLSWSCSHAQIPLPMVLEDKVRIYFSTRDSINRSQPAFIEVDSNNLSKILRVNEHPLWDFGQPGTFDDNGIMPASYVRHPENGDIYMYYVGWNACKSVSYQLSAGLAISEDGGMTFKKFSKGSILDRNLDDPIFATIPYVMIENGLWRAWYISCSGWQTIGGRTEPNYLIKYAESKDGIYWKRYSTPCIDYKFEGEALGRPWVQKAGGIYHMWYSTRGSINYRQKDGEPYAIGYATSADGISWERQDALANIKRSDEGWDSEMLCYCSVFELNGRHIMLYNGNGFGKSGFGYAIAK